MSEITVYIDEAGDPGVRDGLHYAGTRHEWLCVSAVVVRSFRSAEAVEWVKQCRVEANSTQAGSLHYHRVSKDRRRNVCASLATRPCRTFTLASHKTNLREYVNPNIDKMLKGGTFYNWCMRLLLERVTAWVEHWSLQNGIRLQGMKVVFAERGHDWDHFFNYVDLLRMQKQSNTLYLKGPGLHEALLDRADWTTVKAEKLAGLQCADIVASAFYQAANASSPSHDIAPAIELDPVVTKANGTARNSGLTVFPLPKQAHIPADHQVIFERYGYQFG